MAGDHPPLSNENTFGLSFHGQCPVVSGAGGEWVPISGITPANSVVPKVCSCQ